MSVSRLFASLFVACLFPILGASATDRVVSMTKPPPLSGDIGAMPLIARPADAAERRINAAARRFDAAVRKAAADCRGIDGKMPGDWSRNVQVSMHGPGFVSFVIIDNSYCGGAHPNVDTMAIVYDLRTGAPVDWRRLAPPSLVGVQTRQKLSDGSETTTLASKRLYDLFLAGYRDVRPGDEDCWRAVQEDAADGPPNLSVWLDAGEGGLAVQFDLRHAVEVCAEPVVIPLATLKAEGARPELLRAIEAARGK